MEFSRILIDWYVLNKRNLPWRNTNDPYLIWISEIILQQTRVANGIYYYERFIKRFPDLKTLAEADQNEVLKIWQGMGYYSRARNLHETAKSILVNYQGIIPDNYDELSKLKGIGDYTAAAILSFSFNKPYPVLDGNVYRVLSRIFGMHSTIDSTKGKKEFKELAISLIDEREPDIFNQAIMEFGAKQCTPGIPDCSICPFVIKCIAYEKNEISDLPVKQKKITPKNRFFHYFHFVLPDGRFFLYQRRGKDIWKSLYEFPMFESEHLLDSSEIMATTFFRQLFKDVDGIWNKGVKDYSHILTHQKIHARFFHFMVSDIIFVSSLYQKVSLEEVVKDYPLHRLMSRYLENII